jgi:23S rRNA (adenine2030-N6)-methyltransferase
MLAYRHAFHAGNHADVLKHLVLMLVLQHMNAKDKGYRLVDTHAGAGGYSLQGEYANKRAEYLDGIARLWGREDLPGPIADYVKLVRDFNGSSTLKQYPGSPAIAQRLLRTQDELRLFELHPTDHRILASYLGTEKAVEVKMADGFGALKGQLPPPTRRGVVLIDPSYELPADYARVINALREGLERFADGVMMIWYPQLQRIESAQLAKRLQAVATKQAPKGWLHVRLSVALADERGFGLLGSGLLIANPPHPLAATLRPLMPWLVAALSQHDKAGFLLETSAR